MNTITHKTKPLRTATILRSDSERIKLTLYRDSDGAYRWYNPDDTPIEYVGSRSRQEAVEELQSTYQDPHWKLLVGDRSNRELPNRGTPRLLKKHA